MELVKTQMQVCGQDSISGCVRTIQRAAGAGGLARGAGLTVAREVPAFGIYFGSYEVMIRCVVGGPDVWLHLIIVFFNFDIDTYNIGRRFCFVEHACNCLVCKNIHNWVVK